MLPEKIESIVQQAKTAHSKYKRFPILPRRFHEEAQDKLRKGTQAVKRNIQFDIIELLSVQGNANQ